MQILLLILCTLVALEFGIHVIYHAITGKAGLYDPAFSYLKDVFKTAPEVDLFCDLSEEDKEEIERLALEEIEKHRKEMEEIHAGT